MQRTRKILQLSVLLCPRSVLWSGWEGFLVIADYFKDYS